MKQRLPNDRIYIENTEIERIQKYLYLGTGFHAEMDQKIEIKAETAKSKATLLCMRNPTSWRDVPLDLPMRLVRCYVFSLPLNGMESWSSQKNREKN